VQEAIRKQVPVVRFASGAPASRAIRLIAKQLHGQDRKNPGFPRIRSFWESLAAG